MLRGDCRLTLVGSGDYLDQLRDRFGHDERICFAGFHPNPAALIQNCDLFVFPSIYPAESLPTVVIEALYCGVPVVATDVGEVATMLQCEGGGVAGQLLEANPRDDLAVRLAQALQRYIDDPALLQEHKNLTRGAFAKFDMQTCAANYVRLYEQVLDPHSASRPSTSASH